VNAYEGKAGMVYNLQVNCVIHAGALCEYGILKWRHIYILHFILGAVYPLFPSAKRRTGAHYEPIAAVGVIKTGSGFRSFLVFTTYGEQKHTDTGKHVARVQRSTER